MKLPILPTMTAEPVQNPSPGTLGQWELQVGDRFLGTLSRLEPGFQGDHRIRWGFNDVHLGLWSWGVPAQDLMDLWVGRIAANDKRLAKEGTLLREGPPEMSSQKEFDAWRELRWATVSRCQVLCGLVLESTLIAPSEVKHGHRGSQFFKFRENS